MTTRTIVRGRPVRLEVVGGRQQCSEETMREGLGCVGLTLTRQTILHLQRRQCRMNPWENGKVMLSGAVVLLRSHPCARLRSVGLWETGGIDCDLWRQSQCALSVLRSTHDDRSGVDCCTIHVGCLGGGMLGGVDVADDVGEATPL